MYRMHIYLPDELRNQLLVIASSQGRTKADVVRDALEKGLKRAFPTGSSSARALLNLAKLGEKLPTSKKAPKDLSLNHDYYAWGGNKK